ncbi:MAG: acetyl-CoA C-acyltransferase, partial [Candidatus Rokubacteria bacterium]|nr:acetyl-CoA C-acyltransferase [Candidatus Rokubacteria bacterium]
MTWARGTVVLGGCRTPFLRSETAFADVMGYELGAFAVAGLLQRTGLDPAKLDRLLFGNVIQEVKTSNVAREVGLACGIPDDVPAVTLTAACASANVAVETAVEAIAAGAADLVIAGGVETLSDPPIRFRRAIRKRLLAARRAKGIGAWLRLLRGLRPRDFAPEAPAIAEFSTGLTMGDNAERIAKRFGISREAQDAFALRSHRLAAEAAAAGRYERQIVPVPVPAA